MAFPAFSFIPLQIKLAIAAAIVVAATGAAAWFGFHCYDLGYDKAELKYKAAVAEAVAARNVAQAKATALENDKNLAFAALSEAYKAKQSAPQARLAASVAKQPIVQNCSGPAEDKDELNAIIRAAKEVSK